MFPLTGVPYKRILNSSCSQVIFQTFVEDVDQSGCANKTCPNNTRCYMVDGVAHCLCEWPYMDPEGTEDTEGAGNNATDVQCESKFVV